MFAAKVGCGHGLVFTIGGPMRMVLCSALTLLSACTCETEAGLIRLLTVAPQPQADMHAAVRYGLCTRGNPRGGGGVTPEELERMSR